MQLIDGRPVFAATDLVGFLACGHRLALERAAMHGLVAKPIRNDPSIDLIAKRGLEHEARYLADLRAEGRTVVEIEKDGSAVAPPGGPDGSAGRGVRRSTRGAPDLATPARSSAPPPPRPSRPCVPARTSSTRPPSSTGRGAATRTSCSAGTTGRASPTAPSAPGTTRWRTPSSPATSRRRPSCRSARTWTSSRRSRAGSRSSCTSSSAAAHGRRTAGAWTTSWPTTAGSSGSSRRRSACAGRRATPVDYPPAGSYPEPVEHCDVCRWARSARPGAARTTT